MAVSEYEIEYEQELVLKQNIYTIDRREKQRNHRKKKERKSKEQKDDIKDVIIKNSQCKSVLANAIYSYRVL